MAPSPAELKSLLQGVAVTTVTPFDSEGRLDTKAMRRLVDYMIEGGVDLINYPLTVGESSALTVEEYCESVETVVEQAAGRVPVIIGAIRSSTDECILIAKRAAQAGADGIIGLAPYYYKLKQEEVYRHFALLAESTPLGLVVYDHLPASKVALTMETADRLAELPTVVGFFPTTTDIGTFYALLKRFEGKAEVIAGREEWLPCVRDLGVRCISSSTANIAPRFFKKAWEAAKAGDMATVARSLAVLQESRVMVRANLEAGHFGVLASYYKAALRLAGVPCGEVRPPLSPVSESDIAQLRRVLPKMEIEVRPV